MKTPKGWYQDPTTRHQLRWWTGRAWAAAVVDDGAQSFDAEGLIDPHAGPPRAEPTVEEVAALREDCGVAALPGEDALRAPVLSIWHRRGGALDPDPTWSVHDGLGTWLGTFKLSVTGVTPNDRRFLLLRPDGSTLVFAPARPAAVATAVAPGGEQLGSIVCEHGVQHLAATIDDMVLARVVYSVGGVELHDLSGGVCGRLAPPSMRLRQRLSTRTGWTPALMSEQLGDPDPLTARAVNLVALCWEHLIPAWVG